MDALALTVELRSRWMKGRALWSTDEGEGATESTAAFRRVVLTRS